MTFIPKKIWISSKQLFIKENPTIFDDYFSFKAIAHNLKVKDSLEVKKHRTPLGSFGIEIQGAILWNKYRLEIRKYKLERLESRTLLNSSLPGRNEDTCKYYTHCTSWLNQKMKSYTLY